VFRTFRSLSSFRAFVWSI